MPETCVLWWTTNLTAQAPTATIPTNFPTKKLEVLIDRSGYTGGFVYFNTTWNPGREVEVNAVSWTSESSILNFRVVTGASTNNLGSITGTNTRGFTFCFDPVEELWRVHFIAYASAAIATAYSPDGESTTPTGPVTVEEWLERYQPTD